MLEGNERFNQLIKEAMITNEERDTQESEWGFASPDCGPLDLRLRTAMSAIQAGISIDDWDCVAEGYIMLAKLERALRILHREVLDRIFIFCHHDMSLSQFFQHIIEELTEEWTDQDIDTRPDESEILGHVVRPDWVDR